MKQTLKRSTSLFLALVMLLGVVAMVPFTALAAGVDYNHNASTSTDEYYNLISKSDWDNAPGITESEIVLNNGAGTYRQVIHIMKADVKNSFVNVIPTYNEMNTSKYQTATMLDQALWIDQNMDGEVIGVMNCCLSWYSGYSADRVNEPLGFMMMNGEIMFDPGNCGYDYGSVGFPTCVVINKDFDENGNPRPADIPKVEMPQIRSSADLDGWEDTVIPVSSGYIVKDGVNQNSTPNHSDAAPRSVVGITADGQIVMMENDGRQSPFSAGMSMYECAEVMMAAGCVFAANCDGGGSSTFVSQRPGEELKVVNSPSDGGLRPSTSGICFISTAPADGQFSRATITTSSEYYTPNTEVKFNAIGTDLVGNPAEIPADATWVLSDDSFGTISADGVFKSNGKVGKVTAQLVLNGEVKGEKEIGIVWPTDFDFSSKAMTIPFGKTVAIELVATYKGTESYVELKDGDVQFVLSDPSLGTINGFAFTANADENASVTKGTLTATINGLTAITEINLGKGSEVIFDFENDNASDDWFIYDYNVNHAGDKNNPDWDMRNDLIEVVTSESGKVHSGNSALAVNLDYSDAYSNGWIQYRLGYDGEYFQIENAKKIGFWIWMPEEAYANEWDLAIRCIDANGKAASLSPVLTDPGDCFQKQDEAGWRYYTADISRYPITFFGNYPDASVTAALFYIQFYNYQQQWQDDDEVVNTQGKFTYFIDDITIEYSDAADDADAPVFGTMNIVDNNGILSEMKGQTVGYNTFGAEVTVQDFVKANATGIDPTSAKAYIDGKEVDCVYSNGRLSVSDITVADGLHSVKFVICDKMGNLNSIIRQVNVQSGSEIPTINLVPHNPELTNLLSGSVYYIDLVATNLEMVQKIVVDLDLVNMFTWHLDHAIVTDGFEFSYELEKYENIATITITKIGDVAESGSAVIASIPVRVWEAKIDRGLLAGALLKEIYLTIKCTRGILECTDGTVSTFTCDPMKVASELWMNQWNAPKDFTGVTLHKHTAEAFADKDATCTENGYTGRTFCEVCNSVVDWGTIVPATGHEYEVIDGKLSCECGKLFNGEYTDGKTYFDGLVPADGWYNDTYYFINGVKTVGQKLINGEMCTFDANGVYQPNYSFTGFYHDGIGWTYYQGNFQKKSFVVIDGNTHFFNETTGYAPKGNFMLGGREYRVEGEQGKVLGAWETNIVDGVARRRYYYSYRYYKNQWLEIDGEMYYFENSGYALIGTRAVAFSGEYLGAYEFAMDGKMITPITGPFVDDVTGYMHFAENGEMACNKLVKYGDDYYFARNNHLLITWATYITEEQANGLLPAGEYQFGEDGKLIMLNGPMPYGPYLVFYKNGIRMTKEGLYEYDGDYYYVRNNGILITWPTYVSEDKANGLLPAGEYTFEEDGKMLMLNGPMPYGPYLAFYKNGIRMTKEGLYEYDGDYYYVRNNGILITWPTYVSEDKANGLLPAGEYTFEEDGKMLMLNGPMPYGPYLAFYKNGIRMTKEGLYEYDGDYYYVRNNGILITWPTYVSEDKANGLLPAGEYTFEADGKLLMLNGPMPYGPYLAFYKNGIRMTKEGLYEYNGDYYYVRNNGILITWGTYVSEDKANGLLPAGEYQFSEDGKLLMLNGPMPYGPYLAFYKNGIRMTKEGLYEYDGDYYYVRNNGILITWPTYVSEDKANGLLPAGEYTFEADGKLLMLNGPMPYGPYLAFYKDGIRMTKEGLYEYNGDYYYVRNNGILITWGTYVSEDKANGLLPAGEYTFEADGKLLMLNGPMPYGAYLSFYKNGIRMTKEGLYEYEGKYYYVRNNGILITWATYISEDKANGLLPAGIYDFGEDGVMIVAE